MDFTILWAFLAGILGCGVVILLFIGYQDHQLLKADHVKVEDCVTFIRVNLVEPMQRAQQMEQAKKEMNAEAKANPAPPLKAVTK